MASNNLVLQLLITAKDEASAAFGKIFGFLDKTTSATANLIREQFSNLFSGGLSGAADFEAQLDRVAAKGGYTADEMKGLTEEARKVAAQFGVTGTEAAQGLEILAAAGLNAKDAIATLPVVLSLAKSEGISLDSAATKLSDSLSIMGLGFDQAGRMADVLAKGANLSTTSAAELADALANAGGLAKAFGLDLEQTVAILDLLAKNGIKGAAAGTSLAAILTQLQNPASTASKALDGLGITTRDLGGVLDALKAKGASSETAIIAFGETAGPGLRALIGEGSAGLNNFTDQLRDASGAAQQAADAMGGNFKTAVEALSASWETVKQTLAEPLLEPLAKAAKALSDALTGAVQGGVFSGLTDAIKTMATVAGNAATVFVKAFDFKALGDGINSFVAGAVNVLSQAMNNLQAIAGGLVAAALIPMGLQLKTLATETYALVTAKLALARSMTAAEIAAVGFSRVMAVLMGPAGWVLAGVAALTLLWKEQDKTKEVTDALTGSTEEYTKKLKEQTETANKLALIKLEEGLAAQREQITQTSAELDKMAGKIGENITVYTDYGAIVGKVATSITVTEQGVLEKRLALEKATADLAEAEKRRALIVEELKAKQDAANPATVAAEAALGKYRKAVEEANAAQEKAKASVEALTPGTTDYGIAAGQAALADERLKQAKEVLTKAESDYNAEIQRTLRDLPQAVAAADTHSKAIEQGIKELEQGVAGAKKYADAIADVVDAETAGIRAEIALARVKGDTATAQRLAQQLAVKEAESSIRVAKAKEAEQVMEYAVAVAKRNQTAALVEKNQATQEDLVLAELKVQSELLQAQAAGINTQAQEALAQSLREVNAAMLGDIGNIEINTGKIAENTDAVNEAAEAQKKKNQFDGESAGLSAVIAEGLATIREEMEKLSPAAKEYYDVQLAGLGVQHGIAGSMEAGRAAAIGLTAATSGLSQKTAEYQASAIQAAQAGTRIRLEMLDNANMLGDFIDSMAQAQAKTREVYFGQKAALEQTLEAIEKLGKAGSSAFNNLDGAMAGLTAQANRARGEFFLLDDVDLNRLQDAIDSANDKLREMQDEAQSATDRIAELNAEIAAERGDTAAADRLKLQLEQQRALAEVEAAQAQARAENNRELIALYAEQEQKLK